MSDKPLEERSSIRVKNCRHGLFMYNIYDKYVGRSLDLYGEFSELENEFFKQIIKPGMTVVDVGANIGTHTVSFAQHVGKAGQIIAFEPQRIIYQMLCGNIALNELENVSTLMAGVGDQNGTITVPCIDYKNTNNFGGVQLGNFASGEIVPLVTLDSFNLQNCHFIKIDVEGMEESVIRGSAETLKRCTPVMYVENDRPDKSEALIRCILDKGYRLYWHLPLLFNQDNFYKNPQNAFNNLSSTNMIAIPPSMKDFITNELKEITHANAHEYVHEKKTAS